MNVVEKAEKALEHIKNIDGSAKSHELQAAAGTLGRCLGVLGSRQNYARHYANLLHCAIPTLLSLASNDSAEIRLLGDEALNRAVVGGFAFHSYKTNIILQNQIDNTRNARWIRAALSRICLGDCWLRPGVGKIRAQAQTLFPKLSQIVRQTSEIQLIVDALESNLPRILNALGEYTTDEELSELSSAVLRHVPGGDAAVRRAAAACAAQLAARRRRLLAGLLARALDNLWPSESDSNALLGWFGVVKAIFQTNDPQQLADSEVLTVQDYLELYEVCVHHLERSPEHNVQNAVMECLAALLARAPPARRRALLERRPPGARRPRRPERPERAEPGRDGSPVAGARAPPPLPLEAREPPGLALSGALQLGGLSPLPTPSRSLEDLTIQTLESPASDSEVQMPAPEQLTRDLSERLHELEDAEAKECDHVDQPIRDTGFKINIGASSDDDIPLKYCARLLASKFLLTGNKGEIISDRSVRVSVKASALNCLSEILRLYPQAMTMYLDKDAEAKSQNVSGSSDATESTQEQTDDFVLERNVCYQDSMTDSLSRELLDRSTNSQQATLDRMITGRDQSRSTEKSVESVEQKSSLKDVPSNMLDSRVYAKSDLVASGVSADSTQNMTASNFTTNSNTTGSNDPLSTGYPMTSSGDPLSSSLDLDMKLDHFGESPNLDNLDALREFERRDAKRPLKRTDEVCSRDAPDLPAGADAPDEPAAEGRDAPDEPDEPDEPDPERRFAFQHMSDVFALLAGHGDPHIRGLVRACAGGCLAAALDLAHAHAHADCAGGQEFSLLPREGGAGGGPGADDLVEIVLKGLSDDIHSAVNHSLAALTHMAASLSDSAHWALLVDALNCLVRVETNAYWLCRVNLCRFYEKLPYKRLFMLYPEYHTRNKLIMDTLFRLLADQDQKVRNASAQAIATITPQIYLSKRLTPTSMVAEIAMEQTRHLTFDSSKSSLEPVRDMYFCGDLPAQLRGRAGRSPDGLGIVVSQLFSQLMSSSCKYYSQGLLEALHAVSKKWTPWKYKEAYSEQGILSYCLDSLDLCNGTVVARTIMMDLCTSIYPVEIHNIMHNKPTKTEIFERDYLPVKDKWQHLDNANMAALSEKFLQITLKMLNVLAHLIEEVNPNVHMNKSGIALPGSPVRRKTQEPSARRASNASDAAAEERAPPRRRPAAPPAASLRANFAGHFYNEPFYMRLYENLRAMYSNHKINLDPTSSIFYEFLTSVLNSLAIQLEMATERELGSVTEEILYYLKIIMPLRPDLTVYCITQLLKCLFGTNMINQYQDFMTISDPIKIEEKTCFYRDVMMVNALDAVEEDSMDGVESTSSQKLSTDSKNTRMTAERQLLMAMENFTKNKTDRKWSTNKKELERYIRLFEPVVIQALKSYTMQNDVPLQCRVLGLLNQLLTLRVNYCMLDSDQVFIGFLMKQLDLVEQHEIPNCCELVNSILMFLVHLSSSKHHTKQIIEIPKLIQLCDGLMASGAQAECIAGLEPVAVRVFSNMGGVNVLGRAQQQEAQATREVLFYMLQKTMHQHKVLDIVSCVLALSRDQPESYYRWSELAADTLLNLLAQRSVEVDSAEAVASLERLLEAVYRDVLLEQSRVELLLKILFKAPPDQATTSHKLKLRYLSIIMVLIRKVFVLVPESEILLSINYLKSTFVSPQSIFFNVKTDIDPLNVQNVNENCANLSPDVILVRFLFKTLTYAIVEVDSCHACLDFNADGDTDQNGLLVSVCVNIIVQVKHMLHLTTGCRFPLCAKTARALLHSERSGLNTGLYSPDENIPLERLNVVCLSGARRVPLLTAHWSHLLIRLNFLSHQYWQRLVGFARRRPLGARARRGDARLLCASGLQVACVLAYCEYFLDNGLSEAVHLSWLLASRVHVLGGWGAAGGCGAVRALLRRVHAAAGASGLLLQAFAARCQPCLKDEFALNAYKILSLCHESQSGALVFLICRIIGKLEPAVAVRFANLAIERCKMLKEMPIDQIHAQLSKEDVQVALELLQRDKVHIRHPPLALALGALAAGAFDLSPLDLSPRRAVSARYVVTARADGAWLLNQIKSRCCKTDCTMPKVSKYNELALILLKLPNDDLSTVMTCPEFDRRLLSACFRVACDDYTREFLNVVSVYETKEMERERLKEQIEASKREQTLSPVDSNKLNVVNTLHVFKKSDRVDSKSQFFIPVTDNSLKEFGNLQIADDEAEIVPPEFSDLYRNSIEVLDKSLGDIIRLFPKQNRPLSQSENFNLNVEQTIDRYTRRCHQVFQDKLFHDEFVTIHTILTGFLDSLGRIIRLIDGTDCDLLDKCIETIIPGALAKNIAIFSVISLQYLSFIIKNKELVESPARADVSFRATASVTDDVVVDHVVAATLRNVADALRCDVWAELNGDPNANRPQSAIGCLYAVVKYLVKDTKPLILKKYMQTDEPDPKQDIIIVGNKLVTLIEYWETNFYANGRSDFLGKRYRKPIERLIVSLSRLELMSNTALVPPLAWVAAGAGVGPPRVELPLQALQDMDVLESFLFRVNLIGWSSKKQFEEIWVALLGALQGNGTHWAVRGIAQLLGSTAPRVRAGGAVHVPRTAHHLTDGMQRLRSILVGTSSYKLLEDVNLERIPLMNDDFDGYHYAQFDTEYLKLASDIIDDATYKVRREVKRMRRNKEIDVNSCLQLLMDVTSQMLEPKAPTGVAARVALLAGVTRASDVFTETGQWCWAAHTLVGAAGAPLAHYSAAARALLAALATCLAVLHGFEGLHELSSVQQRLLKSLSSSHAPLRQAALHGCLLQLAGRSGRPRAAPCRELVAQLALAVRTYLAPGSGSSRISPYEQSLYWTVLFALVELGHPELMTIAVDFLLAHPAHYCTDLVVKGITSMIRQQVLPKDLKNNIIEKLLDKAQSYSERHAVEILMVHLFSVDSKLLRPRPATDASGMDPDVLMSAMERVTLLYKAHRRAGLEESRRLATGALKRLLRETLPPAASLSRAVIEFIEWCAEAERRAAGPLGGRAAWAARAVAGAVVVFEVFETAVSQDQLPVLSGWIFEALCHLLSGKVSTDLLPHCLLLLLVSASSNPHIRALHPLCCHILRSGLRQGGAPDDHWGIFKDYVSANKSTMSFTDRRLLCIVAYHSNFTPSQLDRLRELCEGNECLNDLLQCLDA